MSGRNLCVCGHDRSLHTHGYRHGTDCARCACWRFRRASLARRVAARVAGWFR